MGWTQRSRDSQVPNPSSSSLFSHEMVVRRTSPHNSGSILVLYCLSRAPNFPPLHSASLGRGEKAPPSQTQLAGRQGPHQILLEEPTPQIWSSHSKALEFPEGDQWQGDQSQAQGLQLTKYPQQHRTHQAYLGNGLVASSDRWRSLG